MKSQTETGAVVAFDLETIANRKLIDFLPEVKPKATLKDPAKIKTDIAEKKKKQMAEMPLDPHFNLICCFGWANTLDETGYILLEEESDKGEAHLIKKAWEVLFKFDVFVTFNGIEFDVPLLNLHSLFLQCRPSVRISTRKYIIENHIDLRAILGGWNKFAPGRLDFYLKRVFGSGEGKPKDIDGSLVQHYWDTGLIEDIGEYCQKDAADVMRFYQLARKFHPEIY